MNSTLARYFDSKYSKTQFDRDRITQCRTIVPIVPPFDSLHPKPGAMIRGRRAREQLRQLFYSESTCCSCVRRTASLTAISPECPGAESAAYLASRISLIAFTAAALTSSFSSFFATRSRSGKARVARLSSLPSPTAALRRMFVL